MPVGKVKWYDPERGFGFVANPGNEDVYVPKQVLPEGVEQLHPGQRIEFDVGAARRGPQALRVRVLDKPRRPVHKHSPEELGSMVADLMTVLEQRVQPALGAGRWPDRKEGRQIAGILRAVAKELDV